MTEITILSIPEVALEKIFSYLSYDEIANNRLVCGHFNNLCGGLLTKGFIQLEKKHTHIYKLVKSLLPRRPSERRSNALVSRYCEILQGMETRIRMLNVTYMRYIDQHLICFVPGKVLDEIKRLLRLIESRFDPPTNNTQLLEELRDLSSMAMEHFDEHILPLLEKREEVMRYKNSIPSTSKSPEDSRTYKELRKLHKRNRLFKTQVSYLISKTRRLSEKWNRQNLRIKKQSSIIKEQNAKLQVQTTRLENHEMTISEIQKKFEELQNNFVDINTKWGLDVIQKTSNISSTSDISKKDTSPHIESNTITKNLRKIIQQESLRQKHNNMLKKLCSRNTSENKTSMNKPQLSNLRRDETRRKCMSMVDMEIWRRRCPTSRLTYSLWHKNYVKNRAEIQLNKNQNLNESRPGTSEVDRKTKKGSDFVYKSVIKQRASRVFPLTCLELERKRKSQTYCDIPSKVLKNDANISLKTLDLINKYLPGATTQAKVTVGEKRENDVMSNVPSHLEVPPTKRKREEIEDV